MAFSVSSDNHDKHLELSTTLLPTWRTLTVLNPFLKTSTEGDPRSQQGHQEQERCSFCQHNPFPQNNEAALLPSP